MQVFRTKDNIWGIRCQYVILADEFVCEFANEFVSDEFIGIGLALQPNMVYSDQLPRSWEEWGDLSKIDPSYVRPTPI